MMKQPSRYITLAYALPAGLLLYAAASGQTPARATKKSAKTAAIAPTFEKDVAPLLSKFCVSCHGGANPSGGLALNTYLTTEAASKVPDVWDKVAKNLQAAHMPPQGMPQPDPAQRNRLLAWVNTQFAPQDCKVQDPGRVTMRRLNREEYNNTIRDLLGVNFRPADDFPSDDVGNGFDNIGDVLSISPLLMEKYLTAAEKITLSALPTPEDALKPNHYDAAQLQQDAPGGVVDPNSRMLSSNGALTLNHEFPAESDYIVRADAFGQQAGPEPAHMEFRVDSKTVQTFDVTATEKAPKTYEARVHIPAGKHEVAFAFTNDYYNEKDPNPDNRDRNLIIRSVELADTHWHKDAMPEAYRRVFFTSPKEAGGADIAARKILTRFAARAYRRPVTTAEVDRLLRYVRLAQKDGGSFERGIQLAIQAVLVSPNFLFRVEPDSVMPGARRPLNDYELATRLSYFLWSSMPDDTLFALAAQKKLHTPPVLVAQVKRMLKDPKAKALGDNFAGQWLQLRNLANVAPNRKQFPDFNNKLREAMRTETEMFFTAIMQEDRSILDFLNANYTFLNGPLAQHYGISGVDGDQFRRVTLTDDRRGGLLSQASVLTVTSNPTRTSPVKRGKWVLEQLLGTPPPPPPPGVGQLPDDKKGPLTGTLRQRMEQHRKNPVCASCHARMDPLGFGLENYDATGGWREKDGEFPVDSSGVLPDGRTFRGPAELKGILLAKKDQFAHCLSEKMLTYALGRGLDTTDRCAIDGIVQNVVKNQYRFSALITAVVQSEPFCKRRGEMPAGKSHLASLAKSR